MLHRVGDAVAAAVGHVGRGLRAPGPERDDLVLGAKSVGAATVAWVLARHLLPATVTTFAPFTVLVVLQATVYRSVRECAQYLMAMAAGAVLAAALAAWAGIHWWVFTLLVLLGLAVGRFRPFGSQGAQVAVVGLFAFSAGGGRIDYIGHLTASVAVGAACGIGAHLLLAPARHTRRHQEAVAGLCRRVSADTRLLADASATGEGDADAVRRLRAGWRRLASECERLHGEVDAETENSRLNPRRTADTRQEAMPRAREALTIAQRFLDHLQSVTRTLDHAVSDGHVEALLPPFRSEYAGFLNRAADVLEEIGRVERTDLRRLDDHFARADEHLDRLRPLQGPQAVPAAPTLQGTLLTDAARLMADMRSHLHAIAARA
ncbi:aromatic acid exporter family protein [Streptomyces sp. NPDC088707]|uniref:aromatic acid exporter family protein n=1 Tax=Streptomyces sp. NPDC088707 TaxID=3365871 RepID=UPI003816A950